MTTRKNGEGSYQQKGKPHKYHAQEFIIFKPDKKLRWLAHLGTVHLELQLDDRTVEADLPPLEAAFIEMFSNKGEFASLLRTEVLVAL